MMAAEATAQSYPAKPIRLVLGYGTGGAVDFTARLVGQKLAEYLGQSVIVENRPGASTAIATERVAASPPDGYTLLLMPTSAVVQSALRSNLPYNIERDLAPISLVSTGPYLLVVHPSVPARTTRELMALARAQPGKLSYGSAGIGSANHLAGELFNLQAGTKIFHVPYKGTGEAAIATVSGEIPLSIISVAGALPLMEAGKVRALAVTSTKRTPLLPKVPSVGESGLPGYEYIVWYGMLAPSGVPADIIGRLHAVIVKAISNAETKDALNKQGFEPQTNTPEQFAALIKRDLVQNARLIQLAGLKPE